MPVRTKRWQRNLEEVIRRGQGIAFLNGGLLGVAPALHYVSAITEKS